MHTLWQSVDRVKLLMKAAFTISIFIYGIGASATRPIVRTEEVIVKENEIYQGVRFPKGTVVTLYLGTKDVRSVLLKEDFRIQGLLIRAGAALEFYDDGKILEIRPAGAQQIGPNTFSGDVSILRLTREGTLQNAVLNRPKIIAGYKLAANSSVEFHPNGSLAKAILDGDQTHDGLNLKNASVLDLYPDGKIKGAKLAKNSFFQSLPLGPDSNPANTFDVEFWPAGRLKSASLASKTKVGDYWAGPGRVEFFESGGPKQLPLAENRKITLAPSPDQSHHQVEAKVGDVLFFSDDGRVVGHGTGLK